MALTTDQAAELVSLRNALTLLRSGQMPSSVTFNGRRTDMAKIDLDDLKSRVRELEAMERSSTGRAFGAVRFRL